MHPVHAGGAAGSAGTFGDTAGHAASGGSKAGAGKGGSGGSAGTLSSSAGRNDSGGTNAGNAAGSGGTAGAGAASTMGGAASSGGTAGGVGQGAAAGESDAGEGGNGVGGTAAGGTAVGGTAAGGSAGGPCVPKPEVCDGVSNDCDDAIDEDGACPAGCSAHTRNGHVYLLCLFDDSAQQLDYEHATSRCAEAGSSLGLGVTLELARLESADENDFIKQWIVEQTTMEGMVWFGANDIDEENRWVWGRGADAMPFFVRKNGGGGMPYQGAFNDFADGRPNSANNEDEDCGGLDSDFSWSWNDLVCATPRLGFVCEQNP